MGGYGSGRPATRITIEGQRRLDVRLFNEQGGLRPGRGGVWTWSWGGEPIGSASYRVLDGAVQLNYLAGDEDSERIPIQIIVQLRTMPCRFGGVRTYFQCPHCRRRCEVIVMTTSGRAWGCRRCLPVRYASQSLAPADRMQQRADALYSRAGTDYGEGFVVKHKWMRWRTFNRLMDRANLLSQYADAAFLYRMRRFGFASVDEVADFALGNAPEERR